MKHLILQFSHDGSVAPAAVVLILLMLYMYIDPKQHLHFSSSGFHSLVPNYYMCLFFFFYSSSDSFTVLRVLIKQSMFDTPPFSSSLTCRARSLARVPSLSWRMC